MQDSELALLVMEAQDGNRMAFERIFRAYQKPLLSYACKITSDASMAEEASQEAWIDFAKNVRKIKDANTAKSWLFRLVRWRATDLIRSFTKRKALQRELEQEEQSREKQGQEELCTATEDGTESFSRAMATLPDTEKQVLHLFYLSELKIREISTVLDIPAGTVKSRLNRARQMLKEKFSKFKDEEAL